MCDKHPKELAVTCQKCKAPEYWPCKKPNGSEFSQFVHKIRRIAYTESLLNVR